MAPGWRMRVATEPVMFISQIIIFIYYDTVPQLILNKLCLQVTHFNTTQCDNKASMPIEVHQAASRWWFYILMSFQLPAIFTLLVSGPLTDLIGRHVVLRYFPLVDMLAGVTFILSAHFMTSHPAFLMIGFFITSLYGQAEGTQYISFAVVSDLTEHKPEERTLRIALIDASLQAAGVFACLTSGTILQWLGFTYVYFFTLFLDVLLFLYAMFYLKRFNKERVTITPTEETNLIKEETEGDSEEFELRRNNNIKEAESEEEESKVNNGSESDDVTINEEVVQTRSSSSFNMYTRQFKDFLVIVKNSRLLQICFVVNFLCYMGVCGEQLVQTLYVKNEPFVFAPQVVGFYEATQAGSRLIGNLALSLISYYCLHLNEFNAVFIGMLSLMVSHLCIGISRATLPVFLSAVCSLLMSFISIGIRSTLTRHTPADRNGSILSLLAAINQTSALVSNLVSVWIYEITLGYYSGVVYFVFVGVTGLAGLSLKLYTLCRR